MIKVLEELKKEIGEEEKRSHVRQRGEDIKEYDYRRGLRYVLRKIEEIEKEEKEEEEEEDKPK